MTKPTLIAEAGEDEFKHLFGGAAWKLAMPASSSPAPAVVLTLDTADERIDIDWPGDRLPLASRIDALLPQRQSYVVEHDARTLSFEGPAWLATGDEISDLPNPLPQRSLRLRGLNANEDLATAPSQYEVQDTFLGNTPSSFLRIGGEPLWLYFPEKVDCTCGRETSFVACVGYENCSKPSGMVAAGMPFLLGELALYFFGCSTCSRVVVLTQST